MGEKMTKEDLQTMIKEIMAEQIEAIKASGQLEDGTIRIQNSSDLKAIMQDMGLVSSVGANGWIYTEKGSVLNPHQPSTPWVKLSKDMEDFAEGIRDLVRSKGAITTKLLQEGSDPHGGYLVPEEFSATMVQYDTEPALVWPRATIWPMTRDKLGMPKVKQRSDADAADFDHFAGVIFEWTEEGGVKHETEPVFEFIELVAHELSGYTAITNILIEDSAINIMNFLTGLFRKAYVWFTDRSFLRGNGARQPLGILTHDPAVLVVNRTTANAVTYADVLAMDSKLPAVFEDGAVWMASKKVLNSLRNERDINNQPVLQQFYHAGPGGVGRSFVETMLGYPVVRADGRTMPLGTRGDICLGNWTWYYIGDRKRFTMDLSKDFLFRQNKTALRVTGRLDGQAAIPESFVVLDEPSAAGS